MVAVDLGIAHPHQNPQSNSADSLEIDTPHGLSTVASIQFLGSESQLGYWAEFVGNQRGGRNDGG
jgi:hypothetical protein